MNNLMMFLLLSGSLAFYILLSPGFLLTIPSNDFPNKIIDLNENLPKGEIMKSNLLSILIHGLLYLLILILILTALNSMK